jgi:hypothetical protein
VIDALLRHGVEADEGSVRVVTKPNRERGIAELDLVSTLLAPLEEMSKKWCRKRDSNPRPHHYE